MCRIRPWGCDRLPFEFLGIMTGEKVQSFSDKKSRNSDECAEWSGDSA